MKTSKDNVMSIKNDKVLTMEYERITFTAKDIISRLKSTDTSEETVKIFNYGFDLKQRAKVRRQLLEDQKDE